MEKSLNTLMICYCRSVKNRFSILIYREKYVQFKLIHKYLLGEL